MAVQKKAKKGMKKSFYDIEAPITATKIKLYAGEKEELVGKTIVLDLTRNLRGKSLLLTLRVGMDGDNLVGMPFRIVMAGSYVRKIVRRGSDYVEDSFLAECKDKQVLIKPFLITHNRVSRAIIKILRNSARKCLENYVRTRSSQEIFVDITSNKIQKELAAKLKKIYPLVVSEVRWFEVVGDKIGGERKEDVGVEKEVSGEVGKEEDNKGEGRIDDIENDKNKIVEDAVEEIIKEDSNDIK